MREFRVRLHIQCEVETFRKALIRIFFQRLEIVARDVPPGWIAVIWQDKKTGSPSPALASGILNDSSRYDNSSTEARVLVAHHRATARPLPKEVRTITGGGTQSPTITIPTRETSSCLLIRQQLKSVYSRCPPVGSSPVVRWFLDFSSKICCSLMYIGHALDMAECDPRQLLHFAGHLPLTWTNMNHSAQVVSWRFFTISGWIKKAKPFFTLPRPVYERLNFLIYEPDFNRVRLRGDKNSYKNL
ncbi:hypothetical protein AVEN_77529-1 [Araneus ventricosus]|uniref:Uncharacterized protein n=1 Tax=Araneus ventricosus TaxID=182803 RepID=A0A4Y2F3C0_ARAVE|nr:hypothetical protein AVEN_77529-1 [Araneus ventricosus]